MAYKAQCAFKKDGCQFEQESTDFDKLADALLLHYQRIHRLRKVPKWASEWEITVPAKAKAKK